MILRRAGAFLLDILIIFGICAPSGYLIQRLIGYSPQTGLAIWFTILWNFSLPSWLYFLLSDLSKKGKPVGKREPGTFTLHQQIGLVAGNVLAFAFFMAMALTQSQRSIHDILLGTEVQFEKM